MSNLFNSNDIKTSILKVINQTLYENEGRIENTTQLAEELIVDKVPRGAKSISTEEIERQMHSARIKILEPTSFHALTKVKATKFFLPGTYLGDKALEAKKYTGTDHMINMPVSEKKVLPIGTTSYFIHPNDQARITSIVWHQVKRAIEVAADRSEQIQVLKDLTDAYEHKAYSNGSAAAQVARLSAVYDVAHGRKSSKAYGGKFHPNRKPSDYGYTPEKISMLLERTYPLMGVPPDYNPGLFTIPSSMLLTNEQVEALQKQGISYVSPISDIKRTHAAGPPFMGSSKGDVTLEALALADAVVQRTAVWIKDTSVKMPAQLWKQYELENKKYKTLYDALNHDMPYLFFGTISPKAERYHIKDLDKKVRNIISASFISHILVSVIIGPFGEEHANAITHDTPSLLGASFTQGGMDIFINKLLKFYDDANGEVKALDFIYADNWYRFSTADGGTWQSLDLHKGEANATQEHAMALLYYYITRGWKYEAEGWDYADGKRINLPRVNQTWVYLALNILPLMLVDARGLLKNLQVKVPGLLSGTRATADVNHVTTTIFEHAYNTKYPDGSPITDGKLLPIMTETGVDIKIELTERNLVQKLRDLQKGVSNNPHTSSNWKLVTTDLLGYDVSYSPLYGYIPVLARERLMPMVVIPKRHEKARKNTDKLAQKIENFKRQVSYYSQEVAAYMVGGQAYPGIRSFLMESMKDQWHKSLHIRDQLMSLVGPSYTEDGVRRSAKSALEETLVQLELNDILKDVEGLDLDNFFEEPLHTRDLMEIMYAPKEREMNTPTLTLSPVNMAGHKFGTDVNELRNTLRRMMSSIHTNSATGIGGRTLALMINSPLSGEMQSILVDYEDLPADRVAEFERRGQVLASNPANLEKIMTRITQGYVPAFDTLSRADQIFLSHALPTLKDIMQIGLNIAPDKVPNADKVVREINGRLVHKAEILKRVESSTTEQLQNMSKAALAIETARVKPPTVKPRYINPVDAGVASNPFLNLGWPKSTVAPTVGSLKVRKAGQAPPKRVRKDTPAHNYVAANLFDPVQSLEAERTTETAQVPGSLEALPNSVDPQVFDDLERVETFETIDEDESVSDVARSQTYSEAGTDDTVHYIETPRSVTPPVPKPRKPVPKPRTVTPAEPQSTINDSLRHLTGPSDLTTLQNRFMSMVEIERKSLENEPRSMPIQQAATNSLLGLPASAVDPSTSDFDPTGDYISSINMYSQKQAMPPAMYDIRTAPMARDGTYRFIAAVNFTDATGTRHTLRGAPMSSKKLAKSHAAYTLLKKLGHNGIQVDAAPAQKKLVWADLPSMTEQDYATSFQDRIDFNRSSPTRSDYPQVGGQSPVGGASQLSQTFSQSDIEKFMSIMKFMQQSNNRQPQTEEEDEAAIVRAALGHDF